MDLSVYIWVAAALFYCIACACLCSNLAYHKGYKGYRAMGFFLGVLGLLYVGFLPLARYSYVLNERD